MKLPDIDESLIPLPPIDGDTEEDDGGRVLPEELGEDLAPDGDGEAGDDAPDASLDLGDPMDQMVDDSLAWSEADEKEPIDVGEEPLIGDEIDRVPGRSPDDDDVPGLASLGDLDVDDEEAATALDPEQGEEGPLDPSSLSVQDEELPPIDADEEGEWGEELPPELLSSLSDGEAHESELSWHEVQRASLPLPIAPNETIRAVLIDPALREGAVLVTSEHGIQRVSRDKGPESRNLWREHGPSPATATRAAAARGDRFLATLGRKDGEQVLWVVTSTGRLLCGEEDGTVWEDRGLVPGTCFRALCARKDGALFVLSGATGSDLCLAMSEAEGDGSWQTREVSLPSHFCDDETRLWIAASRTEIVIGHESGVVISRDGGRSFLDWAGGTGALAGVFTSEVGGTLVVVGRREGQGLFLARSNHRDELEPVARIESALEMDPEQEQEPDSETREPSESAPPLGLAADEERGLIWIWWRDVVRAWGPRNLQ